MLDCWQCSEHSLQRGTVMGKHTRRERAWVLAMFWLTSGLLALATFALVSKASRPEDDRSTWLKWLRDELEFLPAGNQGRGTLQPVVCSHHDFYGARDPPLVRSTLAGGARPDLLCRLHGHNFRIGGRRDDTGADQEQQQHGRKSRHPAFHCSKRHFARDNAARIAAPHHYAPVPATQGRQARHRPAGPADQPGQQGAGGANKGCF